MIKLFKSIDDLNFLLESYKREKEIIDYRIIVGANNIVNVFVITKEDLQELRVIIEEKGAYGVFLSEEDAKEEYSYVFDSTPHVDYRSSRLRLDNLLDQDAVKESINTPIITFYSYKGGVGRSTLLASYALHYANSGKRVAVLDCDFEAPGLDNFFIEDQSAIEYCNGLVEFFLDNEIGEVTDINSYYREVSKVYSGRGEVYVFPSGNLSTHPTGDSFFKTDLDHYLNGLSRLNIFSKDYIVKLFSDLFHKIEEKLHPDIILIDSRTGFNDLYGIASLRFSSILVGLFGGDIQTRPGLEYFMELMKRNNAPRLLIVNSIIPSGSRVRSFSLFKDYVSSFLEDISDNKDEGVYSIDVFPVMYEGVLSCIGKPGEDISEYITMIKDGVFSDYSAIFSKLDEYISDISGSRCKRPIDFSEEEIRRLKLQVLENILAHQPALYGEDVIDFSTELKTGRFFFRQSMEDLFNGSKFLVVGNKGTGKTYLYRSLGDAQIVEELKKKANKSGSDYLFIPAVSTVSGQSLDTVKLDGMYEESQSDLFFERFWQIYMWSTIMASKPFGYKTKLPLVDLSDTTDASNQIVEKINQTDFLIEVEKDLSSLSHFLTQQNNKRIVVVFDELDNIVKPYQWPERISPLIELCRKWQYANISTKLFLRSDLYEKITNITNKNALNNRMIRIEWTREELFSYFFNLVMSHSREQFKTIVALNKDYSDSVISSVVSSIDHHSDSFSEPELRVMCAAFFGKFADAGTTHRFGETYDWFYTNLKNANDTISLRPFIDLITIAIKFSIKDDKSALPILPAAYYTNGKARSEAVERHFKDLAKEKGNTDLEPVFDFIKNKAPSYLKLDKMTQRELFVLLDAILDDGMLTENASRDELIDLLIVNGIMKTVYVRLHDGTHRNFHFALLYKYYLGLRSNPKIR